VRLIFKLAYDFFKIHDIITSPVTEIKDFERVPENIAL